MITNASRLGDFFVIFFLSAEDCAEGYFRMDTEPMPKERLNTYYKKKTYLLLKAGRKRVDLYFF